MAIPIPYFQTRERAQGAATTGTATAEQFGGSIGRELANLGTSFGQIARYQLEEFQKREKFDALVKEDQFLQGMQEKEMEAQQNAQPNGAGYTQGFMKDYGTGAEQFISTLPGRLQPEFRARMSGFTRQYALRSATFERTARLGYETGELNNFATTAVPGILAAPDSHDTQVQAFEDRLNATTLPAWKKEEARRNFEQKAYDARIQGLIAAGRGGEAEALAAERDEQLKRETAPGGASSGPQKTMLDAISRAEGTTAKGYEEVLGSGAYGYPSKPLQQMTLAEAYAFGRTVRAKHGESSAIGRYQIVGSTMRAAADGLGLDWNTAKFDAQTQDRMALWIAKNQGLGAWEGFRGRPQDRAAAEQAIQRGALQTQYAQAPGATATDASSQARVPAQAAPDNSGAPDTLVEGDVGPNVAFTRSLIAQQSFKAQQAAEKAAKEERKILGEDYQKEIYARSDPNRPQGTPPLTREYVEEARPYLSPSEYKGSLALLAPTEESARDDAEAVVDLTVKMDTADPDDFIKDATSYVQQGKLKPSTFRTMVGQNRAARRDDMPTSPYKSGREFVRNTLEPGLFQDRTANAIARAAQARALEEYDTWAQANPQAKRDATMTEAQAITQRYQAVPFDQIRLSLGRSRYFADRPVQAVTIEDVDSADQALLQDMDAERLTAAQAAMEIRRLQDWRKTIERENQVKEQSRGRTRTQPRQ